MMTMTTITITRITQLALLSLWLLLQLLPLAVSPMVTTVSVPHSLPSTSSPLYTPAKANFRQRQANRLYYRALQRSKASSHKCCTNSRYCQLYYHCRYCFFYPNRTINFCHSLTNRSCFTVGCWIWCFDWCPWFVWSLGIVKEDLPADDYVGCQIAWILFLSIVEDFESDDTMISGYKCHSCNR